MARIMHACTSCSVSIVSWRVQTTKLCACFALAEAFSESETRTSVRCGSAILVPYMRCQVPLLGFGLIGFDLVLQNRKFHPNKFIPRHQKNISKLSSPRQVPGGKVLKCVV